MAFGGGSGFSFGNNNNSNTNTTFGGFGTSTTNTGFGASTGNTGFGSSTTGTNPFGGGTSTFGSNTGGFGTNNTSTGTSLFGGNKPATSNPFGTTTGTGSLFGGGGTNNNNNTASAGGFGSSGFGGGTTTGGFGATNTNAGGFTFANNANKPAFGSSTTTPLFGQGGAGTTGGFGNTGAFGSSGTGTALNQPVGPSDGTASTPFSPTPDKEPTGNTSSYQSITFQQPYQKYSFEELRLADYNAGRRFGNGSGQPGAFGSNAFGGFGNNNTTTGGFGGAANNTTGTGLFSGAATSGTTFGNNTATSGFGGGSGLFGNTANKPGGLFGSTTTTSAGTAGGLFGTSNNTNTGFGASNTGFGNSPSTGGGLFGNNNQNKPTGGLFGGQSNTTNNAFSFGNNTNNNNNNTAGGLFGNNSATGTGGGLFGNNNQQQQQQQQNTSGGLFGNNSQGNSLFGNKTGTGFGTSATQGQTGGLFGNASNTAAGTGGGLFGNNNPTANTATTGGLFGNNNSTGGGLFANNNANQAGQKSLFGSGFGTNTGTGAGGGLFGNAGNANAQTSGGLFANNNASTGGFSFGGNNAAKTTPSLFGNTSTGQQNPGTFGATNNNLFGQSQNSQQHNQQQQDGVKHASLLDPNPYGQSSIWTGLPQPTPDNAKPVFTPLSATQKMKESMMKPPPSLRLNQSRYMTPPRRNGFGLSYSTYGTPSSAASTPGGGGLSGSMYGNRGFSGGSFGRSFNKSASVQNLRSQFASDSDDIWKPGAFTSTHRNSGGSIKRLTIDRTIRNDLFNRPSLSALPAPEQTANAVNNQASIAHTSSETQHEPLNKLKKRVSFENGTSGALQNSQLNGETGALVRTETDDDNRAEEANTRVNGTTIDTQSRGKDLAAVPEDRESHQTSSRSSVDTLAKEDPKPGDYWMSPSRAEQAKMPREKLQKFKDFRVGRYGCGQVTFNGTVDLTALPLDDLYDKIVEIRLRSVTVYPEGSSKPPVGKGLNVPSTISIENSWPRARGQPSSATSGHVFDKHIQRLKKMAGTEFVDYETTTGIWTFRVPHYTRYGLDYDEDEDMSELTAPPDTIERSDMPVDSDDYDDENEHDDEDDTFAFRQKIIPGGFGRQSMIDYEPKSSALVQSVEHDDASEHSAYSEEDMSEDEPSMAGSYPAATPLNLDSPNRPILKASRLGTPGKPLLDLEGDWADQLQRTISPRKQNREVLRETQNKVMLDRIYSPMKPKAIEKKDFRTSIDVMNSLFGLTSEQGNQGRKQGKAAEPEFEYPYAKRAKTFDSTLQDMSEADRAWHQSFKNRFTSVGDFIYRTKNMKANAKEAGYVEKPLVGDRGGVVVQSAVRPKSPSYDLKSLLDVNEVVLQDDVPFIRQKKLPYSYLAKHVVPTTTSEIESDVYNLLHILFDDYEDEFTHDLPPMLREQYEPQIRSDRLTRFLSAYVVRKHGPKLLRVEQENPTAAAVLKLTAKDTQGACDLLEKGKNYKLMVLVSQIENADEAFQDDIMAQLDAWREQRVLSEMNEDIRTLYELCSGNTVFCAGISPNGVPVEDRARSFNIGEEYGLDWIQRFALGFWFGRDEKRHASRSGSVNIEHAVLEFNERCRTGEEHQLPGNDPMWAILRLYANSHGAGSVEQPEFPTALDTLNDPWDASRAFHLFYSIAANIEGVNFATGFQDVTTEGIEIDEEAEEELTGLLAYQLSARGELADAAYVLLHLKDADKREQMIKSLLERFAGQLPDPPVSNTDTTQVNAAGEEAQTDNTVSSNLWTVFTQHLRIPDAWLYKAKALHARAVHPSDPSRELTYLVAAKSWDEAHDCFAHRVAPGLVVDDDIATLTETVNLFEDDVMEKVSGWDLGGGVYADFALLCTARGQLNQSAVEGLRKRLVELGRRLKQKSASNGNNVDLGTLPVEELEERVAVQEMSRVVAERFEGSLMDILELPLTSDRRLVHAEALAVEYYRGVVMAGAAETA